jgi:spore germination protein YaaH
MWDKRNVVWRQIERGTRTSVGRLSIYGLLVLLLVVAILLPPIELVERILSAGYTRISTQRGGYVAAADGAQVLVPPEGMRGETKLKLSAVPRRNFLEGSAGNRLFQAAENIPAWLVLQSPYYRIQFRGQESPSQVLISLPMPADSDPRGTLDLYTWNGRAWEWLPHLILPESGSIEAELDYLPASVAVMQTKSLQPLVSADLAALPVLASGPGEPGDAGGEIPVQAQDLVAEINAAGLLLDAGGTVRGDPGALPPAAQTSGYTLVPTLRNWEEGGVPRSDLVDNMLADSAIRDQHVGLIVETVVQRGYPGIDVDYRGVSPDLRTEYAEFITQLAEALHAEDKRLAVRVELPAQVALDRWETGGYDWLAIGAAADVVKIPAPADPQAYAPGGWMDAMLEWAAGQVNRYKLHLLVSTHSTVQSGAGRQEVPYPQALGPFSQIVVEGGAASVAPGQTVSLALASAQPATGIQYDAGSGLYWYAYADASGQQRTVWLENGASLARKLQYVAEYHLGGVAVEHLLGEENDPRTWEALGQLAGLIIPPVESRLKVVWQVQSESGKLVAQASSDLSNPRYTWTAPQEAGEYRIAALVSSDGVTAGSFRGSIAVRVAGP